MSVDALGSRMKEYEGVEAQRRCMPRLPVLARLDGKNFSRWTKGLKRPYDERLSNVMVGTTYALVENSGALVGYTQSDEITLVFYSDDPKSQIYFDGRIQKMCSVLAAQATAYFNALVRDEIPEKADRLAVFDCRVWQVPNMTEAANAVLWREQDATKNSIQMAAQEYYSHNQLLNKNGKEQQAMLLEKDINWNDYPAFFKRGTFVQRRKVKKKFSAEELERLPAKHAARQNPDLEVERSVIDRIDMPPFGKVLNREQVIFVGADPLLKQEEK